MYLVAQRLLASLLLALAGANAALAQDEPGDPSISLGGLVFGDAYHLPSHHLSSGDGATGVVMRRAYLTLDSEAGPWFGRGRIEVNQSGEFETYDFEADAKDLYVGYRLGSHTITAGLQPTLSFDVIEAAWGRRYLMRTPTDLQGIPSRDTGFSVKGRINDQFSYRAMVGVGSDFGAESGEGNQTMLALNWRLSDRWALDFYYDQEERPGRTDVMSGQVFAAYTGERFNAGAQYSYRDRQDEPEGELFSAYGVYQIDRHRDIVGRIDRILEPSIRGDNIAYIPFDPSAPATMYVGAYEHRLSEHLTVTPNLIFIRYDRDELGERAESDFYIRLTLFIDFE